MCAIWNIGPLKSVALNYDSAGKSKGTGTIIFKTNSDAARAIREYNGRTLDERVMRIELIVSAAAIVPTTLSDRLGKSVAPAASAPRRYFFFPVDMWNVRNVYIDMFYHIFFLKSGRGGRGRGGRGRGGRGGPSRKPKSAEELDAEMDTYMKVCSC